MCFSKRIMIYFQKLGIWRRVNLRCWINSLCCWVESIQGGPCSAGLRGWKETPTLFWLYLYPAAKAAKGDSCWRWNRNECQFSGMIWDFCFWDPKSNNWDNYKTTQTVKNIFSYSLLPPKVKPEDIIPFLLLLLLKYMSYELWLGEKYNRVLLVVIIARGLKANKWLQWQLQ